MQDARSKEKILADIESHFASARIYRNLDQFLKDFLAELGQL